MIRILVINPSSNEAAADGLRQALAAFARTGGPEIVCETLAEGPFGVETQEHVEAVPLPLRRDRCVQTSGFDRNADFGPEVGACA
ncbi:hypothetical protein IED13_01515 [Bosea sp. SSUT16]|uniref:Asp/Glu racemase n=1 Tax=Bosea spartocytisi TaxID=2773451 RepID=A0A927E4T2_9HYPH|nr:hypothetical protein [Bosea spartocytisi]MBD3844359.1 hypothetical protein [Bosea spartocytisi]MCT4470535.1 aspartate/glutamate racemase family protein [Bosea spartocytisi]